ncbi:ABC transporter ATP-binding protein [Pseudorhodoplanes sp.]|uniref:ABC transporter ATP-binding protein n=1 Tax=Pseudorhodoplanes sp. TaxID=1934341 RepID=UPI003D0A0F22
MSAADWHAEREVLLEGVSKAYGDEYAARLVIDDCSFRVEEGKFTVLIGPSGCGKSTLINLIAGYERPTAGRITCDGKEIVGPTRDRLVLFQETALFPWMTIFENVMYGPTVQGRKASSVKDANELLAKVGLSDFRDKYPMQLSGGMQRRAELARTLINRPRVLLMDEPLRGLDAMTRQLMQEYILKLFEGSEQTILFVTTEIDEAILFADRLILLSSAPATTRETILVDIPRPRDFSVFQTKRYAELKAHVLSVLYNEALQAFASGSRAAADMVQAFEARRKAGAT